MASEQLTVVYDGPALDTGQMAVRDLAPSLLAFADLLKEIQRDQFPEDRALSVHLQATRRGSFQVDLSVAHGFFDAAQSLLAGQELVQAKNLEWVIAAVGGLVALLRKLARRKIVGRRELGDGQVMLTLDDGTIVQTDDRTLALAQIGPVRRFLRDWLAPLRQDGITVVKYSPRAQPTVEVTEAEFPAFDLPDRAMSRQVV